MSLKLPYYFSKPPFEIHIQSLHEALDKIIPDFEGLVVEDKIGLFAKDMASIESLIPQINEVLFALTEEGERKKINPQNLEEKIAKIIRMASDHGTYLMFEFAAQNMIMGIMEQGKTKEVADYLYDAFKYAQTGALYEVIEELDRLLASNIPATLAPFITRERLSTLKDKIKNYLGVQ